MAVAHVGYWWSHQQDGSNHRAWCNLCELELAAWVRGFGTEGVPAPARAKIDAHRLEHHPELP